MSEWEPTMHLRWVNTVYTQKKMFGRGSRPVIRFARLQQKWRRINMDQTGDEYEWRILSNLNIEKDLNDEPKS